MNLIIPSLIISNGKLQPHHCSNELNVQQIRLLPTNGSVYLFCSHKLIEYTPVRFIVLQIHYTPLSPWPKHYLYAYTIKLCLSAKLTVHMLRWSFIILLPARDYGKQYQCLLRIMYFPQIAAGWSKCCFLLYNDMSRLFIESEKCGQRPVSQTA